MDKRGSRLYGLAEALRKEPVRRMTPGGNATDLARPWGIRPLRTSALHQDPSSDNTPGGPVSSAAALGQ